MQKNPINFFYSLSNSEINVLFIYLPLVRSKKNFTTINGLPFFLLFFVFVSFFLFYTKTNKRIRGRHSVSFGFFLFFLFCINGVSKKKGIVKSISRVLLHRTSFLKKSLQRDVTI